MIKLNRQCSVIFFILIGMVLCDYQTVVAQIDQQSQLKQTDAAKKNQLLTNLYVEQDTLKQAYAGVVQKSTTAESAYTSYFLEKTRCEGLNPQTDFIGEVSSLPDDFCLPAPIGASALDVYNLTLQLADAQYLVSIRQKLVDQQVAFNADYFTQSTLNSKLTQAAYIPLQTAVTKYQDCMKKYATTANPNPVQCKALNDAVNARAQIYGNFRSRQISFGMASKGPVLSLDMKKGVLNGAIDAVNRYQTALQPKLQLLQDSYNQCIANLQNIKITTNRALQAAQQSRNKVSDENDKISQIYTALTNIIIKIKADTAAFSPLVTSLKQYFP